MGSTRLPGKVMMELAGRPLIDHVIERVSGTAGIDDIVVATSHSSADDPLVDHLSGSRVAVFRGSETDVLARYAEAARFASADAIVRVTADCPLLSPAVSGRVVAAFRADRSADYVSNTVIRSFPRGLDTEVCTLGALLKAHHEATDPADREHVTPFLWRQPQRFAIQQVVDVVDRSHHRWTVDTPADFDFVQRVYSALQRPGAPPFEMDAVLRCLDAHPDWVEINRDVRQKELGE
jgi:spore coat polysaccharide biosynthesis protein SpsF